MSEFVQEFMYKKSDGSESRRKVLALSKDNKHICGLDLSVLEAKLGQDEVNKAIKCIEDYAKSIEETNNGKFYESLPPKAIYPNYNVAWNIAYRYFKVSGISPIPDKEDNIDLGVLKGD